MNNTVGTTAGLVGQIETPQRPAITVAEATTTGGYFKRFPSLDGWRAVSILLVLAAHCKFAAGFPKVLDPPLLDPFWSSGNLGVRFFFVISGFLITYLLVREFDETGCVSLKGFYIRRALRILPVYAAFLLVVVGLQLFTPFHQTTADWIANATFTTDFHPSSLTTAHLWSLSVEEQFYLLWPFAFALIGFQRKRRLCLFLCVPILLAPVFRLMTHTDHYPAGMAPFFQVYSFLNYFDSLSIGCLTAILLARFQPEILAFVRRRAALTFAVAVLLVLVPGAVTKVHRWHAITLAFSESFQAIGFALLILESVLLPHLFKPLNWPVMKRIGVLSYSIYIWQEIFCTEPGVFGLKPVWWLSFPGWLVPVFVVAAISFYGFEKPLMALRARFRRA